MIGVSGEMAAKICITGAGGRLGRYVVPAIEDLGALVLVDRHPVPGDDRFRGSDILDLPGLRRALDGVDTVVHLAAIDASVAASDEAILETNLVGTWNVLHAAAERGVRRVIVCSSSAAFGLDRPEPHLAPRYLPIDERHPLRPSSTYSLSKALCEQTAEAVARRVGMDIICLRPTYVMFPDIVASVVARLAGSSVVPGRSVAADPIPRREEPPPMLGSYVRPEDVAQAVRLALSRSRWGFQRILLCADDSFHAMPTLALVEGLYGFRPEIGKPWIFQRDPQASVYDNAAANEILGWRPTGRWAELVGGVPGLPQPTDG